MVNSTNNELAFFDTNILIYQFDKSSPEKRITAQQIIKQYFQTERGVISTQVVQEFMNVALGKFDSAFVGEDIKTVMVELLVPMLRHYPDTGFYTRTLGLFQPGTFTFYDTMIVQAALDLGCDTLYSEDMQDGRRFGKLVIVNPFK